MKYYWVIDFLPSRDGTKMHPVVIGGRCFTSEMRAQQFMDNTNVSPKCQIMELDTANESRASQEIKAKLAEQYHSLSQGMTKAVHKLPGHRLAVGGSTYAR